MTATNTGRSPKHITERPHTVSEQAVRQYTADQTNVNSNSKNTKKNTNAKPAYFIRDKAIGQIVFNQPDNRNSMTPSMLTAFSEALEEAIACTELRCLVLTGTGTSFCAGGDFSGDTRQSQLAFSYAALKRTYLSCMRIGAVEVPVIGALNGHAIGGGFGVALLTDMRVANQDALYGANFARLGMHSGMSISYMLPRLIGLPRANELMFTGRRISGAEAERMGLVNYAVPAADVLPKALSLAEEIAACAPAAVRMMKRSMVLNYDWNPAARLDNEALCQATTFASRDCREGINALLEKREPRFSDE